MDELNLPDPPALPEGELLRIGGAIDRVTVSLRFFGDDLDPEQVTDLLGCRPTLSHRKGDILPSKRVRRIAKTGSWLLIIPEGETGTLEQKLSYLLDSVSADFAVWANLQRFQHDVFCGLFLEEWNRGGSLSPEIMRRLSERDLTLGFDIYGPVGEEE